MHDGLGQELTGLSLSARALANRALRERDSIAGDLEELSLLAASCIKVAHDIVRGLSPLSDADGSLDVALQALVQRTALSGTRVEYRSHRDAHFTLNLKTRNHLYRIAQEALQNSLKHADARQIDIELSARDGVLRLSVLDDGKGMSVDGQNAGGLGMRTMRFRASAIGGRLVMSRPPGGGNSIVCEVPLAKATYDRDAESRTARARGA